MKTRTASFKMPKWNALPGIILALVLVFSVFSPARASAQNMQNCTVQTIQLQDTQTKTVHMNSHVDGHHACCEDEKNGPCHDKGSCKSVCTNTHLSCAVLSYPVSVLVSSTIAYSPPLSLSKTGISDQMGAPPPRN